jgi:hypothetical protein
MRKSKISTAMSIFTGFIIGIGGYEVYKSYKINNSPSPERYFLKSHLTQIKQFEIIAGRQITKLILKDSNWYLELNDKILADTKLVNSLIKDIQDSITEQIPSEIDEKALADYGLDDPLAFVKFTNEQGQSVTLSLSPDKAYNGDFYLKYEDGLASKAKVLVSNYSWLDLLLRNSSSFLSLTKVIDYSSNELQRVKVDYLFLMQQKQKANNVYSEIEYLKNDGIWSVRPTKGQDPATVASKYLQMEFASIEDKTDTLIFYNKFKSCDVEGIKSECQLLSLSSLVFPFWVEKSKLKFLVEQDYLIN